MRRGAELLSYHTDIPGLPQPSFDAPEDAGPLIYDARDLAIFIRWLVSDSAGRGVQWQDKPFYISAFLFKELDRTDAWQWLDRGFEKNRKRAGIIMLDSRYFIIKGDPYWHIMIGVINRKAFEGGPATFPIISFG